jgi:hypothetical protein
MLVGGFGEDARSGAASFWSFISKAAFFEMYLDFDGFFLITVGAVGANGFFWFTLLVVTLEEEGLELLALPVPLVLLLVMLLAIVGEESEAVGALMRGFGRMSVVVMNLKSESLGLLEGCGSDCAERAEFLLAIWASEPETIVTGRFFVGSGLAVELIVEGDAFSEAKDEGFGKISRSTLRCGFRAEGAIFCCCC